MLKSEGSTVPNEVIKTKLDTLNFHFLGDKDVLAYHYGEKLTWFVGVQILAAAKKNIYVCRWKQGKSTKRAGDFLGVGATSKN